MLNGIGGMG
eukprot:gene25820-biopygen8983